MRRMLVFAVALALGAAAAARGDDAADRATLKGANVPADGPGLLEFFRQRTHGDVDNARLRELIRQLGDDSFEVRERASGELVSLGKLAVPALKDAERDPDPEVTDRAGKCLALIRSGGSAEVASAAARVLARLHPSGSATALLAYAPSAGSDKTVTQIAKALADSARRERKLDAVIIAAVTDKSAARRQIAGEVLAQAGDAAQQTLALKLLSDSDPNVRLHVGIDLAQASRKEAIPTLIELVGELDPDQSWPAVDVLTRLAGEDQAPVVPLIDAAARQKSRSAWTSWWHKYQASVDMTRLRKSDGLGYTLLVLLDLGRAFEMDGQGKIRWQVDGLQKPLDIQLIPGKEEHVLVAEQQVGRVTERTTKGRVVWEKEIENPLVAQRLPGGITFICTTSQLVEFDRQGKTTFTYNCPPGEEFMRARKLANGDIAAVLRTGGNGTSTTRYVRLDRTGTRELSSFSVRVDTQGGRVDVLNDGRVLIPQMNENKVVEYDAEGKSVWELDVDQPIAAVRLLNGHTLVTSMGQNRAIEFDRAGHEVWQYRADTKVSRAFRR